MIVDCRNDFLIRQMVNQSLRLIKELGHEHKIKVVIEADVDSSLGYSVVMIDVTNHEKIKVSPERLNAYYARS